MYARPVTAPLFPLPDALSPTLAHRGIGPADLRPLTRAPVASRLVRVLVVGGGAREHALCRALAADPAVTALACAPGNGGTASVAETLALDASAPQAVADLAAGWGADLVVVGPEGPLVSGAAD